MGFCFNNAAVGVRHALDVHGLTRVALIDFDVHHGNGSEDILKGDERADVQHLRDRPLPFNGQNARNLSDAANMVHVGLAPYAAAARPFAPRCWTTTLPALDSFRPQLIYISAGFDAHREDDMGNLGLCGCRLRLGHPTADGSRRASCPGRIVSCLEGGYVLNPLARSVAAMCVC